MGLTRQFKKSEDGLVREEKDNQKKDMIRVKEKVVEGGRL